MNEMNEDEVGFRSVSASASFFSLAQQPTANSNSSCGNTRHSTQKRLKRRKGGLWIFTSKQEEERNSLFLPSLQQHSLADSPLLSLSLIHTLTPSLSFSNFLTHSHSLTLSLLFLVLVLICKNFQHPGDQSLVKDAA